MQLHFSLGVRVVGKLLSQISTTKISETRGYPISFLNPRQNHL